MLLSFGCNSWLLYPPLPISNSPWSVKRSSINAPQTWSCSITVTSWGNWKPSSFLSAPPPNSFAVFLPLMLLPEETQRCLIKLALDVISYFAAALRCLRTYLWYGNLDLPSVPWSHNTRSYPHADRRGGHKFYVLQQSPEHGKTCVWQRCVRRNAPGSSVAFNGCIKTTNLWHTLLSILKTSRYILTWRRLGCTIPHYFIQR